MNKLNSKAMAQIINSHLENGFNGTLTELQESLTELDNIVTEETEARELIKDLGEYQTLNTILDYDFEYNGELMTDLKNPIEVASKISFINAYEILANSEVLMETWLEEVNDSNRQAFISEFTKKYL